MPKEKSSKKSSQLAVTKKAKSSGKVLSTVKNARVTKTTQTPKAKSKEVAKASATKAMKPKTKKKVKEPTPEPESSESDSKSSSSAKSSSESDEEDNVLKNPNHRKSNGGPIRTANSSDSSASNGESSDSDDSESESEDDAPTKVTTVKKSEAIKVPQLSKSLVDDSDSEASSADDDDDKDSGKSVASDSFDEESDSSEESKESPSKKRKADAEESIALKKTKVDMKTKVDTKNEPKSPDKKTLFVGNLSWNVDEEWLAREFEPFGELTGCRLISDKVTGKSKGYGYVDFVSSIAAQKALNAKNGQEVDGREINIDFSTPRVAPDQSNQRDRANSRGSKYGDFQNQPSDTLFVGNISFDATSEIVGEQFSEFGTITRVSLPTDMDSGSLKGFGYVGYSSVEEAQKAMNEMNGASICGRAIRLDFATPRTNDGSSPRGGRGGSRGGRGGRGSFGGNFGGNFGGRGGRGGSNRGSMSSNRGGFSDFKGKKLTF